MAILSQKQLFGYVSYLCDATPTFTAKKGDEAKVVNGAGVVKYIHDGNNWVSQDVSSKVDKTTTINGHALTGNITISKGDVGLGNVANLDTSTTENITDFLNKRFVTDADITKLGNLSGVNTGDETNLSILTKIGYTPFDAANISNNILADAASTVKSASVAAMKAYADGLVVGLLDDRGNWDASGNTYPTTGGSGDAGAILKGDLWIISVGGTLGGNVIEIDSTIRALVDNPGQTAANWAHIEHNFGYVPEDSANRDTLTLTNSNSKYPTSSLMITELAKKIDKVVPTVISEYSLASFTAGGNLKDSAFYYVSDSLGLKNVLETATGDIIIFLTQNVTLTGVTVNATITSARLMGAFLQLSGNFTVSGNFTIYSEIALMLSNDSQIINTGGTQSFNLSEVFSNSPTVGRNLGLVNNGSNLFFSYEHLINVSLQQINGAYASQSRYYSGVLRSEVLLKAQNLADLENRQTALNTLTASTVGNVGQVLMSKAGGVAGFDYLYHNDRPDLQGGLIAERYHLSLAQHTVVSNTSGTNTGDETVTTLGNKILNATEKTVPIDLDWLGIVDSTASNILKKLSWANLKSTLKAYFDQIYQWDISAYTKESTGFVSPELIQVTYSVANRTITLNGTVTFLWRGKQVTSMVNGWVSTAHSVTSDIYYLFYNGTDYIWQNTSWSFDMAMIAYVDTRKGIAIAIREVHGLMQHQAHKGQHDNSGTYVGTFGAITGLVAASTTAANRRPLIAATTLWDEDCPSFLTALLSGDYTRFQLTGTTANPTYGLTQNSADIVNLSTNQPYYNLLTGGNWTQALMTNNNYQKILVLALPVADDATAQKNKFLFVQGQTQSATIATIRNISSQEFNLGDFGINPELVAFAEIIIQYTAGNWVITEWKYLQGTRKTQFGTGVVLNKPTLNKTITIEAPTASEDITLFRVDTNVTVQEINLVSVGTTPSTTLKVLFSTDRNAAGTELLPSTTTTNSTTGQTITSFTTAQIPTNSWVWLETTAASGTGVKLSIDIRYTED